MLEKWFDPLIVVKRLHMRVGVEYVYKDYLEDFIDAIGLNPDLACIRTTHLKKWVHKCKAHCGVQRLACLDLCHTVYVIRNEHSMPTSSVCCM